MSKTRWDYPKGKLAKVRIRTIVNGQLSHVEVQNRTVYRLRRGGVTMWGGPKLGVSTRKRIRLREVDGSVPFEVDYHVAVDGPTKDSQLLDALRQDKLEGAA
jgi:hypothetical protein